MKVEDVMRCSFPTWYRDFKKLTFHSIIIPLPAEVVTYLQADGLVLPEGCTQNYVYQQNSSDESSNDVDWDAADDETPALQCPAFPEFNESIRKSIKQLGGEAFVKLNWSAPKDATWISLTNSLKCRCPADIYLLLKSSDFILHDLSQPFKDCEDGNIATSSSMDYYLVLRKWVDINPGTEFRCFVRKNEIIAVCQRDSSNYYSYIHQQKDDILQDILSLFYEKIQGKFPCNNYVFDMWRKCKDNAKLIDFNPFGQTTDGILFEWDELLSFGEREADCASGEVTRVSGDSVSDDGKLEDCNSSSSCNECRDKLEQCGRKSTVQLTDQGCCEEASAAACTKTDTEGHEFHSRRNCETPAFRFITSDAGVQPHPFRHYGVPRDVLDLNTGEEPLKLLDLMKVKMQSQESESSGEEEERS